MLILSSTNDFSNASRWLSNFEQRIRITYVVLADNYLAIYKGAIRVGKIKWKSRTLYDSFFVGDVHLKQIKKFAHPARPRPRPHIPRRPF